MPDSHSRNRSCTNNAVLDSPHHTLYKSYAGTPYSAPSLYPTPGNIQCSQIKNDFYFNSTA